MTEPHRLAALMIENARAALSGAAAAQLTEAGEVADRDPSFDAWRANLDRRLQELGTALLFEEPTLFAHEVRWAETAFENRGLSRDQLQRSLQCLREVLLEKLPSPAGETATEYLDLGIAALGADSSEATASPIEDHTEQGRLALRYLEQILQGSRTEATARIVEAAERGMSLQELFEDVLMPVQREIGNQWHRGELSIAEEHFCTSTTQHTIAALIERAKERHEAPDIPSAERGVVAIAACSGNLHDMPLRILAGLFEESGWRVIQLGCDVPPAEVGRAAVAFTVDLVLLSATLSLHLPPLERAILEVRRERPETQVLVGGQIFSILPSLSGKVGADGMARSTGDALAQADELVASRTN